MSCGASGFSARAPKKIHGVGGIARVRQMVAVGDDHNMFGRIDVGTDAIDVARLVSAAVPLPLRPPPMISMHKT
jgi:hypothetical protein